MFISAIYKQTPRLLICAAGLLLGLIPTIANVTQATELVDRIVAVVNDDVVSLYELNLLLKPYSAQIKARGFSPEKERRMLFEVRQRILDKLIDQKLADQELERMKIKVSDREIDHAIERFKESKFLTDEQLREGLAAEGMDYEDYRNNVREQLLRAKLVNREVKSKIVITPEDVKSYYESHIDQYSGEKKYHLKNIFLRIEFQTSEKEKAQIKAKMQSIQGELNKGQSFEELARQYSEAPSAAEGGELGSFKLEELSAQLQEIIKDMKAGEYSPIIETDLGYQIIYVQSISNSGGKSFEQVKPEIREKLFIERVNGKYQAWLEELRNRSHIKIVN